MTDIFISYKKEDVERVTPIAAALAQAGYDVWWDHRIPPGRTYRDVIGAALQSAKCVIVVWSKLAANAQWVLDEADEGKKRNVLLPIMIDEVEIPYGFRQIEAASLIGWNGDTTHSEWISTLETVAHFVGRPPGGPPKPFMTKSAGGVAKKEAAVAAPSATIAPAERNNTGLIIGGGVALLALFTAGYAAMQLGLFGAPKAAQVTETSAPVEPVLDEAMGETLPLAVLVNAPDTGGFRRQSDGSWVEFAPNGAPRYRFIEEHSDGDSVELLDDTRDIRVKINPSAHQVQGLNGANWDLMYEITEVQQGAPPKSALNPAAPAQGATRVWFSSGGMLMRDASGKWLETDPATGLPNNYGYRVESSDANTINLRDDSRNLGARIAVGEGAVYLNFPDWGEWRKQWQIRAVDYE